MDSDFTTVISEKQIEKASPSNSQRDLSSEEAGKLRLHALLELKNIVLRLEATTPIINKTCNQGSYYEKYGQFSFRKGSRSHATSKLMFFIVSKDEWNIKEDNSKPFKNALDILWYTKRHLSG